MHPLFHPLYIEYCTYFNGNRDYFECHEVLEEYWKEIAPGERQHPLVGYVQIATGLYHWRRGNLIGAERILTKGLHLLQTTENSLFTEKINIHQFLQDVCKSIVRIQHKEPFQPFAIEIIDRELQQAVNQQLALLPELDRQFIINKHTLRDRSEVIAARNAKLQSKNT